MDNLSAELAHLQARGLLRELTLSEGLDFASNDYLGFSTHPQIHAGLLRFMHSTFQLGATGSRLISGHTAQLEDTENFLARSFNSPASLIFGTGYLANIGVCVALGSEETEFFSDRLNHASLIDGLRLSKSRVTIFDHNDVADLAKKLSSSRASRRVIVTESIFSMDGDLAPLAQLIEIANSNGAYLVVDEAHATGAHGLGALDGLLFDPEKTVVVHTCGKALGAYGAFVCSSDAVKKLLVNKARTQIYTTALPPYAVEHIRLAVSQLLAEPEVVTQLASRVNHVRIEFNRLGLEPSGSHIVPVILGSNEAVIAGAQRLQDQGFFVKAIRSPTVALGSERLRITLKANHKFEDLNRLSEILAEVSHEYLRRGH